MNTLFDKIWDAHVVQSIKDGPDVIYIDQQLIHEVTSPQAFAGIEKRGVKVFRPKQTTAVPDHNVPTLNQELPIKEELSRIQVETLARNCANHDITHYGLGHEYHGVVHIVGPELGLTQPGLTMVCGDSHTSTHGAFGAIAFGVGTSEIEMVFASQCIMQPKPKSMRITVDGSLKKGVGAKDIILYIISKLSTSGGTGYFVEFAGDAIRSLTMEGRMTVCNMSIEMGARGGLIAPDQKTFDYLKGRVFAPKNFDAAVENWKKLYSEPNASFDKEYRFDAADIEPMITYGTNPGMGMGINDTIPTSSTLDEQSRITYQKSLKYMDLQEGQKLAGKSIDYVFIGSCTNGRIEDFRIAAEFVKGKQKAANVVAWLVPGSKQVENQIIKEGLVEIFKVAGFEVRQPGCSACLAMNEDKVPEGKYAVATSNRNFEGRQGPGSRTFLASPLTAIACAITGKVTDARDFL